MVHLVFGSFSTHSQKRLTQLGSWMLTLHTYAAVTAFERIFVNKEELKIVAYLKPKRYTSDGQRDL